ALKILNARFMADERNRELILREGRSAAAVTHPNIAAVYDVHDTGELTFIAMELIEGDSLRAVLARGPIALPEVLRIAREMARGLARAHDKGIVHRDLKPDNVMLAKPDGLVKP